LNGNKKQIMHEYRQIELTDKVSHGTSC
jgi:hypothetical protein